MIRAAVLREVPGRLQIEQIQLDEPGPREVLVRTAAVGVCHSDLHFMQGKWAPELPIVLGHEASGVVLAVGAEVRYLAPGDHVIGCLTPFCGHCEYCISGRMALCRSEEVLRAPGEPPRIRDAEGEPVNQFVHLSAFAERMLVHEHALVKIDPGVPLDRAALVGCATVTGVGAVLNTARVGAGESVAVVGVGGIGLNCVQGARVAGAGPIVAIDRNPAKLELARELGATHAIDATQVDPVAAVLELTDGGVHHAFEAVGAKEAAEQAFAMLRRGGTATVVGLLPQGVKIELLGTDFVDEKRIQGSNMGSNRFRVDMPRYLEMARDGRLELDRLISRRIRLEELNDAFDALERGEVARSVVVFE